MKKIPSILFIGLAILSCGERVSTIKTQESEAPDSGVHAGTKELIIVKGQNEVNKGEFTNSSAVPLEIEKEIYSTDSIFFYTNESFQELETAPSEITQEQFIKYLKDYTRSTSENCKFSNLNLKMVSDCDEICETYLVDQASNIKTLLPCDYDSGILGISFSPDCNKLVVCSSYDGPGFIDYYEYRAEFFIFNIDGVDGLNSLRPSLVFSSKKWSIEDCVWISNNKIGLKIYSGQSWGGDSNLDYDFFEIAIPD